MTSFRQKVIYVNQNSTSLVIMSFHGKDMIDISFEEFDDASPKGFFGKKTQISGIFEDFSQAAQKLPNSVQAFLAKTDKIQEDIRRQTASPDLVNVYKKVNGKLKELGFEVSLSGQTTQDVFLEVIEEILNELFFVKNKGKNLEKELQVCKEDKNKTEERCRKTQTAFNDFEYESCDENLEDLFKEIMNKSFNSEIEDDMNIYTFIKYVEIQRSKSLKKLEELSSERDSLSHSIIELQSKNKDLLNKLKKAASLAENNEKIRITEQVCLELGIKSVKELPEAIHKFQQVMFALPGVEKFVAEISEEFVGEYTCKKLEDIVPHIKNLKKQIEECEEFKKRVFLAFGSDKIKDIVNFGRGLSHFCKLFEVPAADQLLGTVEELFYFVRQIKGFVSVRDI